MLKKLIIKKYKSIISTFTSDIEVKKKEKSLSNKIIRLYEESSNLENLGMFNETLLKLQWAFFFIKEFNKKNSFKKKYLKLIPFEHLIISLSSISAIVLLLNIYLMKLEFLAFLTIFIISNISLTVLVFYLYLPSIQKVKMNRTKKSLFQFSGIGTKNSPLSISSKKLENVIIHDSEYFIKVNKCEIKDLGFFSSKNISFDSCSFNYIVAVGKTSNCSFNNCKFLNGLVIHKSNNLIIKNSDIEWLSISLCYENKFINNTMKEFEIACSKNNMFQNNDIKAEYLKNFKKIYTFWEKNSYLKILIFLFIFSLSFILFTMLIPGPILFRMIIFIIIFIFNIPFFIWTIYIYLDNKLCKQILTLPENMIKTS